MPPKGTATSRKMIILIFSDRSDMCRQRALRQDCPRNPADSTYRSDMCRQRALRLIGEIGVGVVHHIGVICAAKGHCDSRGV